MTDPIPGRDDPDAAVAAAAAADPDGAAEAAAGSGEGQSDEEAAQADGAAAAVGAVGASQTGQIARVAGETKAATTARIQAVRTKAEGLSETSAPMGYGYSIGQSVTRGRVLGMAAEAAFWGTFTLPWILLAAISAIGFVSDQVGEDVTRDIVEGILDYASDLLSAEGVENFLLPLIDEILTGSASLSILGFVVALWSGSRVISTFVEASRIIHGTPRKGWLHTRARALLIYLLGIGVLGLLVFAVLEIPVLRAATPLGGGPEDSPWATLWVIAALVISMTTLQWLANPRHLSWWYHVLGGLISVALWLLGSVALQVYIGWLLREGSLYGAIVAPIAIMLWVFVTSLAVMLGMTFTAARAQRRERRKREREGAATPGPEEPS